MDAGARLDSVYRPDIDGLRAVAVLAVIGFHAFSTWVPSGYVGVDIFFVISGYLISQQLFAGCEAGQFRIRDFYVRRVRRIVPALLAMMIGTIAFGWIALTPREFHSLQQHVAASAFFSNNLLLWWEAGYFDAPARTKPLLHLWSLGVEEQFYIVWPLLIAWAWRRGVRRTTLIGLVVVASFAVNVGLVADGYASAAFYLPVSRLWQIATGAWLASFTADRRDHAVRALGERLFVSATDRNLAATRDLMSWTGVIAILVAAIALAQPGQPNWWTDSGRALVTGTIHYIQHLVHLDPMRPSYPGWPALLPTIGAALIIAAGPEAWVNRTVLSRGGPVFIGLISYPLYLWHWPLLSFLSITEPAPVSGVMKLAAIAAAAGLAVMSYLALERPIRTRITPSTPARAAALAGGLFAVGVVMVVGAVSHSLLPPTRVADAADEAVPTSLNGSECVKHVRVAGGFCQQYAADLPVTTALLGDSHASHLLPGLGARLAAERETVVHLGDTDCPPLLHVERSFEHGHPTCADVNDAAFNAVAATPSVRDVVLAFRYHRYTSGSRPGESSTPVRVAGTAIEGEAAIETGLEDTVRWLSERGKRVTIVLPTPEMGFSMTECIGRPWSLSPQHRREPCAVRKADVLQEQAPYRAFVAGLQQRHPVTVVDPLSVLCDDTFCFAIADGKPYYMDDNHLGMAGSAKVSTIFTR